MTPIPSSRRARRVAAGLAGALVLGLAAAPAAPAAFSLAPCTGEGIFGRGASFQNDAIAAFRTEFQLVTNCNTTAPAITYDPAGSGAGRRALGEANATTNPSQDRDPSVRFAGTDEAPSAAQRAQIEAGPIDANGADVTAADNGKVHVIPVAIGAISVMVHLPSGCTDYGSSTLYRDRPTIQAEKVEAAFAADASADTWGELLPGLDAGADCAARVIKRVVRKDDSGTTFGFKQWLGNVNGARNWSALANQAWPNDSGATAVLRPAENGGGNQRTLLASEEGDGGIGYADLSTSRGSSGAFLFNTAAAGGYDDHVYLPLEIQKDTDVYRDPQISATGYQITGSAPAASGGANCFNAEVRNQGASTLGDWSATDSTYSAAQTGEGDYAACALTYDLAFDDHSTVYCNSAAEERKARTVKDYLEKGVVSAGGQERLRGANYAEVPAEALAKARAGVAAIDWKKGTSGRPCTAPPTNNPPGTTTVTNTVFVPVGTTPPPAAISNAFTLTSVRYSGNRVRVAVQLPGAGRVTVGPTAKPSKGRSFKLTRSNKTASAAGTQRISFALNAKAKKALKRFKKLKLTVAVSFTPTGGSAARKTRTITIRAKRR